ncbi:lysozyme [Roseibium aquae]|uniref:Lysozyme n=1 Tax=Roseibium aquae TaxID=1323746 RepID=A0A916TMH9_9HYPH|nr:GH25 family lysozyme [Roseibium aquae]GGB58489.1 lysozyme [Roseibium aquae]
MGLLQSLLRLVFYCAVGSVIVIVGAAYFFMTWEPDRDDFPTRGIDISHHQGEIDWKAVAADDVGFVYMKASEGGDFQDRAFAANWQNAGAEGLARGAYHFFSLCKRGVDQARNFLAVLPREDAMLPPVLDLEFEGNCPRRPERAEVLAEISAFVAAVEQTTGRQVVLYAPDDFYRAYLAGQGLNRPIWVRSLWHSPAYGADWLYWQYHARGAVKGIRGEVDLNVLQKDRRLADLVK